jgi:hypothetical protein
MYDLKLWHLAALPTKKNPFRFIARINSRGKICVSDPDPHCFGSPVYGTSSGTK